MDTRTRSWLTWWCVVVGAFGAVLALAAFDATDAPTVALLDLQNLGDPRPELDDAARFALGLVGAVTLGWAVTFHAVFRALDELGASGAPIRRILLVGVVAWFVIDSAISIATGFPLNVVSNVVLVVGLAIPLARERQHAAAPAPAVASA